MPEHRIKTPTRLRVTAVSVRCTAAVLWGYACCLQPAHAGEEPIPPSGVIGAVSADWNGDGEMDRAVLVQSQVETDEADLLIYFGQAGAPLKLIMTKPGLVWSPDAPGMSASLQVSPRGSLIVRSGNEAVGRGRWSQSLTLAWRDATFVVAGYSYSSRDTLVAGSESSCDANLLTGKGVKDNKPFRLSAGAHSLEAWSDTDIPSECR